MKKKRIFAHIHNLFRLIILEFIYALLTQKKSNLIYALALVIIRHFVSISKTYI